MQFIQRVMGPLLLVAMSGCSTLEITSDFDPSAKFGAYKTFAWEPKPQKITGNPRLDNPLLEKRVKAAVEKELIAKGFSLVSDAEPDFFLAYHVALDEKVSVSSMNNYYGYAPGWGWNYAYAGGVDVYQYEQGALMIDIIDGATHQLVWRGSAQAEVDQYAKEEKKDKLLNSAVSGMLAKFPPTSAGK